MGDTEILAVKDLPCDIVPQLIQRTEDGRKSPALVMRQQTGNIFKQQKRWSFNGGNSGDLKKESASCVILESSAEPCDTEGLTGKTAANKVDIRQGVWINGSCVCKIQFSFRWVHGVIRLLCVFIYLAVADALIAAEPFKPRPKAADTCEHIQKIDRHKSSDRYRCSFRSASLSLHCHTEAFPNIVDLDADANQDNRLFNFLLFLFPYYLKAAMRKGLFKKYIRHRYNDGNVKGTIDVARHIEKNTPFVGNVAYSQREFSYDNSLMELVRHTVEFIKRKPYGNKLLIKVKDEVKLVIDATPGYEPYDRQKIIEQNKKNTVRHAYFREYLALQRLCLLILRHQKHQIGTGARQIYGILFDGAWLWEEYINLLIEDIFYHPMNKSGTGAQRLFDGNVGLIYPDFISRNSQPRIIADAKYKPLDNIGNRDYLQLLAYMFRFDAKIGYYIYPEAESFDDLKLWMNCGSTYEKNVAPRNDISVTKCGLRIPMDVLNYAEFSTRMHLCEQEFKRRLTV